MAKGIRRKAAPVTAAGKSSTESEKPTVDSVCEKISASRKQDIFLFNGPIDDNHLGSLVVCSGKKRYDSALLILCTYGGEANSAYRIARFLNRAYSSFSVYVPSYCKSAGTLLALGANQIIMSDFAELGPLDVQLYKADEIGERRSGLIIRSAMESLAEHAYELFETTMINIKARSFGRIRFTTAAELAAQITVGALTGIYEQVDPVNVGEDHRDLNVAIQYGNRLAEKSNNVKDGAVEKLVHNYPSHDFVIDVDEAKTLFNNVEAPGRDLYMLTALLQEDAIQPRARNGIVKRLSKLPEVNATPSSGEKNAQSAEPPPEQPAAAHVGNGAAV
jgi:serine dehydrogenase proteinase